MNTNATLAYHHVFQPGTQPDAPPLLLLHGTGGNEHDLLSLGRTLSPGSALLSPRGDVNEHGQLRFFRRFAEGVFDLDDVAQRTHALADFVASAAERYGFSPNKLIAVGFSNGANIAATLLQLRPESLSGAVLFRPMVVIDQPARAGSLAHTRVQILSGEFDPIVPPDHPPRLAAHLRSGGAQVIAEVLPGTSHGLTREDIRAAAAWFAHAENPGRG